MYHYRRKEKEKYRAVKETLDSLLGYNKRLFRQVSAEGFAVFDSDDRDIDTALILQSELVNDLFVELQ